VTVALSADGGDELFGGYPRYQVCERFSRSLNSWMRLAYLASAELLDSMPPAAIQYLYRLSRYGRPGYAAINDKVRKFVRMARSRSTATAYDSVVSEWTELEAASLLAQAPGGPYAAPSSTPSESVVDQFMMADISHYLVGDLLTKLDRTSMAVSLEAREPFLDDRLAAVAAALPMRWKIRSGK
jgi:asparagine synthase (glutamine-hydrolysing)